MRPQKQGICIVGHLLGRNQGQITTQGQILADLLFEAGYPVISCSSSLNRLHRLVDILFTIAVNRNSIDLIIVEVYSGLGFIIADSASILGSQFGIPVIGVLHGGSFVTFSKRFPRWTARVMRRFYDLVAPSSFMAIEVARVGLKAKIVPNIIALEKYPFRLRKQIKPALLWMRTFHPIYNPEMALKVLALVRRNHPARHW